ERLTRPAVDPRRPALREYHVGRPIGCHSSAEARRLTSPPPDRLVLAPSVVVVGPDEEVEAIEPRLAERPDCPRFAGPRLPRAEAGRIDGERDHDRLAAGPRLVEPGDDAARIVERLVIDGDDGRVPPRL